MEVGRRKKEEDLYSKLFSHPSKLLSVTELETAIDRTDHPCLIN